jgi:hypothetical protein
MKPEKNKSYNKEKKAWKKALKRMNKKIIKYDRKYKKTGKIEYLIGAWLSSVEYQIIKSHPPSKVKFASGGIVVTPFKGGEPRGEIVDIIKSNLSSPIGKVLKSGENVIEIKIDDNKIIEGLNL